VGLSGSGRVVRVNWQVPTRRWRINPDRVPASVWIRAGQLFTYLRELGIRSVLNDRANAAPVVVFVRCQDAEAQELARECRRRGSRVVYDLCVNYYDCEDDTFAGYGHSPHHREECLRMTDLADVVFCASRTIADRAAEHHPWIEYLPDSFDRRHFNRRKQPHEFSTGRLTAGFSGTGKKVLEISPVLPVLADNGVELVVISDEQQDLGIEYKFLKWRYRRFPDDLLLADFCLSYRRTDSSYNRGHSSFKVGVFMTEGIPAVASPVPSYLELLGGGHGGAICSTDDDWSDVIENIVANRDVLRHWSHQAREVTRPYATDVVAKRYRDVFVRLAD